MYGMCMEKLIRSNLLGELKEISNLYFLSEVLTISTG